MSTASTEEPKTPAEESGYVEPTWTQRQVADSIVHRHVALASGAALVPVPLVDVAAITAVQLNMIHRLSALYGVSFTKEAGKNVLLALIGSSLPLALRATGISMLQAIPGVGTYAGIVAMPALSAASTYATGEVMIRHYASGGTLLNFDARKARDYFQKALKEQTQTN